jgi:hypothetical protein
MRFCSSRYSVIEALVGAGRPGVGTGVKRAAS